MNLIAIDIGNSNIDLGLFLKDEQKEVISVDGGSKEELENTIKSLWGQIPIAKSSKEKKRDGVIIACSVNPEWTKTVEKIVKDALKEKLLVIGKQIPMPIQMSVEQPETVGMDRLLVSSAAYAVVEKAVVVADFGTAVTIDLVDDRGVFCGGCIFPGFTIEAKALHENTAQLPKIEVTKPELAFGKNTKEAINAGLYYSAVGALEEIIRRYAETIGTWPKTIITGSGAAIIKDDCQFIDSYVPHLVIKGIALAYRNYLESKV